MASVKRTFSIPDEISHDLDQTVPAKERSKFIALSIQAALEKKRRQEFDVFLDNIKPVKTFPGVKSEDILRELRAEREQQLEDRHRV